MTGPPSLLATREPTGGTTSADTLIEHAHKLLTDCGITMSPSRVTRLVRQFKYRVESNGFAFESFLANTVQLTVEERRKALQHPDIARVVSYTDTTGETAVKNVMRLKGLQ